MNSKKVEAVVMALVPEFEFAHLEALDGSGDTLCIGQHVEGVNWRDLRVGQRLRCDVEGEHITRVLSAEMLPDPEPDESAAASAKHEESRQRDPEKRIVLVEAVVTTLFKEFNHVVLLTRDEVQLCIGKLTPGVDWRQLVEGDRLTCLVQGTFATRVLFAKVIGRESPEAE